MSTFLDELNFEKKKPSATEHRTWPFCTKNGAYIVLPFIIDWLMTPKTNLFHAK